MVKGAGMPELEERLGRLEARLENLFDQFDKRMADRFQAMNTRLGDLQARFTDLNTSVNARIDQLNTSITARIDDLRDRVVSLETTTSQCLTAIENRLTTLEGRLDQKASNWLVSFWAAWVTTVVRTATPLIKLWP
jgi:chromosome segregation ATPase